MSKVERCWITISIVARRCSHEFFLIINYLLTSPFVPQNLFRTMLCRTHYQHITTCVHYSQKVKQLCIRFFDKASTYKYKEKKKIHEEETSSLTNCMRYVLVLTARLCKGTVYCVHSVHASMQLNAIRVAKTKSITVFTPHH